MGNCSTFREKSLKTNDIKRKSKCSSGIKRNFNNNFLGNWFLNFVKSIFDGKCTYIYSLSSQEYGDRLFANVIKFLTVEDNLNLIYTSKKFSRCILNDLNLWKFLDNLNSQNMSTRVNMLCPVGLGEICNRKKICNCSSNKYNICFKKNNFNGFSYKRYNICVSKLSPINNNFPKKYRYSDAILSNSGQISFCKSNLYEFTKNHNQRRFNNSCKCSTKRFSIIINNRKFTYLGSCNGVHCNISKFGNVIRKKNISLINRVFRYVQLHFLLKILINFNKKLKQNKEEQLLDKRKILQKKIISSILDYYKWYKFVY